MLSKEQLAEIKLTESEVSKLNSFIGTSVRENVTFPVYTETVASGQRKGIQELYNLNESTLNTMAGHLDAKLKAHKTNFNPRITGEKGIYFGPFKGHDVLDMVVLIIREKAYNAEVQIRKQHIEELKAKIEGAKSLPEKRAEWEKELLLAEA